MGGFLLLLVFVGGQLVVLAGMIAIFIFFELLADRIRRRRIPRPSPPDWLAEWRAARQRFRELRDEYAGYECDPSAVLRLPALADVTVASTGRFVDAFAEALALHGEHEDQEPAEASANAYVRAVEQAWRAWRAAREAAERLSR
ncbi:hypothetical protein [Pseudonocardia acaciae]|uniref:hypothetical protein n=1 Tax=Pseudonocardia acaciae TaxID=551276 RepID=UPI000490844F|nr:hypothetical protein [Pseudonocardia acaciae]